MKNSIVTRTITCLALTIAIGVAVAVSGLSPFVMILVSFPLGLAIWHWLLFGDDAWPFQFLQRKTWPLWTSVLRGNSNLGTARSNQHTLFYYCVLTFAAINGGYQLTFILSNSVVNAKGSAGLICTMLVLAGLLISHLSKRWASR